MHISERENVRGLFYSLAGWRNTLKGVLSVSPDQVITLSFSHYLSLSFIHRIDL
jgi:hypothetical protein